eukprot:scaffold7627_cov151-Isochrysis_galbana.AAC.1
MAAIFQLRFVMSESGEPQIGDVEIGGSATLAAAGPEIGGARALKSGPSGAESGPSGAKFGPAEAITGAARCVSVPAAPTPSRRERPPLDTAAPRRVAASTAPAPTLTPPTPLRSPTVPGGGSPTVAIPGGGSPTVAIPRGGSPAVAIPRAGSPAVAIPRGGSPAVPIPRGGHSSHRGARSSTTIVYLYMASTRDIAPSSRQARHFARCTGCHRGGAGVSRAEPCVAWQDRAYRRRRSSSVGL